MRFGVVAHDAMPFVSPIYLCPSCTTTLHSDRTTRRALRAISHRSLCQLEQKKNSLHHHGSRSHDDVDTDTESKCDTRCASLENHLLCLAVIPKAEGQKSFQKYTFFATKDVAALQACRPSLCEKPANLERVRRIPSDTWRPRSIAKSTLNRNRSTEIQKLISADMRRQKQTSRFRYARSNLDMWSTCALKKKHLRRMKPAVFTDVNNPVAGKNNDPKMAAWTQRHQEQRRLLINGRDPRALSDNTTVRRAQGGRANKCNTFNKPVHACARVAPGTLLIITSKSCPPSRISSCPEAVIFVMSSTIFQLSGNVPKRNRKQIVKLRTWVEQSYAAFGKDTKKRTRLQNRYVLSFASDYESPFLRAAYTSAATFRKNRRAKWVVTLGVELSCVLFSSET